jgi:glycosyltransferase involved in cell wall biosynthesis
MRIGIHCHRLDRTGAPIILFRLVRHLVKSHAVDLLLPRWGRGPLVDDYAALGVTGREIVTLSDYDVFIANTLMSADVLMSVAGKVPVLYWVHEPQGGLALIEHGRSDPKAFARADRVVFPTLWQAETLFRPYLTRDNWEVVPYGIGVDTAPQPPPFEKRPGKFYLLQLGMLDARKGQDVTVRALEQLANPDIEVFLCGAPTQKPDFPARLRAFVEEHPILRNTVHFQGSVSEATVNAFIQHCDAMIFPTRDDLITLAILEGMLFGRCPISSDFGPIPETIIHGESGLLFPVGDSAAMAANIDRVYRDRALLARLNQGAKLRYEQRHSFAAHVAGMERALRSIARG